MRQITQRGGEPVSLARRLVFALERRGWIVDNVNLAARLDVVQRLTRRLRVCARSAHKGERSLAEDSDGGVPKRPEGRQACTKYT